jgi:deoxycytidine triphosphate deaminase
MSKVISGKALQKAVIDSYFLSGGDVSNCDGIKYDFRLDDCILKAKYGVPINYSSFPVEKQGTELVVSPGEMVFVMSKETLNLPKNVFSQLSPRRKMTEFGIITLGGLAIDPGYNGKLLFGLFNISSENFKLVPNAKLVGAVFFELENDELLADYVPPKPIDGFSSNLIEKISKYQPVGINTLEEAIVEIQKQLEAFKKGLLKNTDSIEKLEELMYSTGKNIERISEDIKHLSDGLKLEAEARKNISKELDVKIAAFKGALWLATALGAAAVAVFIGWLTGLIKVQ